MSYLSDEIESTASELDIPISKLSAEEVLEIRKKLAERFSLEPEFPWRLSYQNLKSIRSIHDPKGWSYIQDYVGKEEAILFVNPDEDKEMWSIPSGTALTALLNETIGFTFYVTSRVANYMLCFDDHDCLIATGEAVEWVHKFQQTEPKSN